MLSGKDARANRNCKRTQTATGADLTLEQFRLLTVEDVADLCAVSTDTVYRWTHRVDNALPVFRVGNRCTRFRLVDVQAFIEGAMNG